MCHERRLILLTIAALAFAASVAVAQPNYELRTRIVDPTAIADATGQFGMSKLKGPYVCPYCGYSSTTAGQCPNPFGLGTHPANVDLVHKPLRERMLEIVRSEGIGGVPTCDIAYGDTGVSVSATPDVPNQFRSVAGRPFQRGSDVFAEFAWPGAPDPTNTRVHFLTMPPGVNKPMVCYDNYNSDDGAGETTYEPAADPPRWQTDTPYSVDDYVIHDFGGTLQLFQSLQDHNSGDGTGTEPGNDGGTYWQLMAGQGWVRIHLNPHRIADGDHYYLRYISRYPDPLNPGAEQAGWRIWLYSELYGLEFDTGFVTGDVAPPNTDYIRLVAASGAAIVTVPVLIDPDATNDMGAVWEIDFQTHSNCHMCPEPGNGQPPGDWGNPDPDWAGLADNPQWHNSGVYLQFEGDTLVTNVDTVWTDDPTGTTAVGPASPYSLNAGELGPGRTEVQWQNGLGGDGVWDLTPNWPASSTSYDLEGDGVDEDVLSGWYYSASADENPAYNYDVQGRPTNESLGSLPPLPPPPGRAFVDGYEGIESRFFASRYNVPPTAMTDHHGNIETGAGNYARVGVGPSTGANVAPLLPGETSAKARFAISNTIAQGDVYYVCPACGAVFDELQDRGMDFQYDAADYNAWVVDNVYLPGDKVSTGGTVYLCTRKHMSAADNEPGSGADWQDYWEDDPDCYPEDKGFGVCPYHGDHGSSDATHDDYWAPGSRVGLVRVEPVGKRTDSDLIASLTAPEIGTDGGGNPVPFLQSFPYLRPHIPDEMVDIAVKGGFVPVGSSGTPQYARVSVPPRQPSSEPGENPGNSADNEANWGYRATAVSYHDTDGRATRYDPDPLAPEARQWEIASYPTPYRGNDEWDSYYVCPDCGMPYSGPGAGPPFQCQNPDCPGHEWCPVCGAVYPAGTGDCPFDGETLNVVDPEPDGSGTDNIDVADISGEEFDAYDIQVTVPKRTQVVAETDTADMGRVGPGIGRTPDTTVAAAGGTPPGRRPEPAGFSYQGGFAARNEGNTMPQLVTTLPGGTGVDDAWYRLFRPEAEQTDWQDPLRKRGWGWTTIRNPIARYLQETYLDASGVVPLAANNAAPWKLVMQPPGPDSGPAAGAGTQRGNSGGPLVPAGQVLGRYSGPQIYFLDMNGNNALDFRRERPGMPDLVTSARYVFNPERDRALEPCVTVNGRLRVSEARLPYNEYQCIDTAPVGVFSYDNNGIPQWLRVTWMTNDPDPGTTGSTPPNNAPMNLVYGVADIAGPSAPPAYDWQAGVNSLTSGGGFMTQRGPLDTYPYPAGYRTLWTSTNRVRGGLRSVIGYTDPSGTGVIWTGQEQVAGVRGFFDPDEANNGANPAHWTFWQAGDAHERIMYKADFADGTSLGGKLPLDNSISPADPQRTVDTFIDGDGPLGPGPSSPATLQKFPKGPFSRVKDASPLMYLPPVVYQTGSALQPMVRVFFAGYARHLQNFDIYEARFNRHDLLAGLHNNGKLEFRHIGSGTVPGGTEGLPAMNPSEIWPNWPQMGPADAPSDGPGEEFTAESPQRQAFHSRHLDWATGSNFVNGGGPGVTLVLGIKRHHTLRDVHYYPIQWGPAHPERGEMYDASKGVYRVIPRICRHKEENLFTDLSNWTWPNGPCAPEDNSLPHVRYYPGNGPNGEDEYELIDPTTYNLPDAQKRPLVLEIDPVLGRVRFSSPLFNSQNPQDQHAVFTEAFGAMAGTLEDVFIAGEYSPFLWRHTLSPADDDAPSALLQSGAWHGNEPAGTYSYPWPMNSHNNRVLLLWRRSFGSGQAPYHGRTCYLTKLQSWTIQVHHPPIVGNLVVRYTGSPDPYPELHGPGTPEEIVNPLPGYDNLPPGNYNGCRAEFDADMETGEIAIWRGVYRWTEYPNGDQVRSALGPGEEVRVIYDYEYLDAAGNIQTGTADEVHRIGGWSQETVVPIETVVSEGPVRVTEERYLAPSLPTAQAAQIPARRYWLFWTSTRPVYDLRQAGDGGSTVRQSSDVYYCTITPEFPTLVRDRRASSCSKNGFRPSLPPP